jgi:hypothetical protein
MNLRFVEREILPPGFTVPKKVRILQERENGRWVDVPLVEEHETYIPTSGSGNNP